MRRHLYATAAGLLALSMLGGANARDDGKEQRGGGERKPAWLAGKLLKILPGDDQLTRLVKERHNAGLRELQARYQMLEAGSAGANLDQLLSAANRMLLSELDLTDNLKARVTAREKYLELAKEVERLSQARHRAGAANAAEVEQARYMRLDAEIQYLRDQKDVGGQKK